MAELASYLRRDLVSHTRKVQNLFKRIVRNETSFVRDATDIQYILATVRAEFDKHKNVRDLRTAKLLLEEGERKLWLHKHPVEKKFLFSPGGLMFEREHIYPDSHLDLWHPVEKAQYPYYFATREKRKEELIKYYESQAAKSKEKQNEKH